MKTSICATHSDPHGSGGFAFVSVLLITTIAASVFAGVMQWTTSTSRLNERNNQYNIAISASEAATEKVLASLARDYKNLGESSVYANLDSYRAMVPTSAEDSTFGNVIFDNANRSSDKTYVSRIYTVTYVPLESQYSGLKGFAAKYRVLSNTRFASSSYNIKAAVQQDIQLASVPVFQFAIFYNTDMELNGAATLDVPDLSAGTHTISAYYLGDDTFAAGNAIG